MKTRIHKAYDDKLDKLIGEGLWRERERTAQWERELQGIEQELSNLGQDANATTEEGLQLLEIARQASALFKSMNNDEKREILNLVLRPLE